LYKPSGSPWNLYEIKIKSQIMLIEFGVSTNRLADCILLSKSSLKAIGIKSNSKPSFSRLAIADLTSSIDVASLYLIENFFEM
jgi:hypothetical protein